MAKVIVKCRYYSPENSARDIGGMLTYIATRKGAEKFGDSWKTTSPSKAQKELVVQFTEQIKSCQRLPEYQDYLRANTKGSASEFISAVLENYPEMLTEKTYLDYIATRPNAEQIGGRHALFTDKDEIINLSEEADHVRQHTGNVFTIIVSLKREDAERLGFNNAQAWRDMVRGKISLIAKEYNMPLDSLHWFGAYHNESHHPHIHLMIYSDDKDKPGFINSKGIHNLRHLFGTTIFRDDLKAIYDDQTKVRNKLNASAFDEIEELAEKIRTGLVANGDFVMKFVELAKRLQSVKGKKVYGYLPQNVRQQVCELVDILEKDEDIARMYELWYQAKCAVYHTYTDNDPVKKPLSQEEAFKPIRNVMIKEANALGAQLARLHASENSPVIHDDKPHTDDPVKPTQSPPTTPQVQNPAPVKPNVARAGFVATSIARFGNSLSRTFRNNFYNQVNKSPVSVDSRLQREIEAKKKGQNLSM